MCNYNMHGFKQGVNFFKAKYRFIIYIVFTRALAVSNSIILANLTILIMNICII